MKDPYGPRDGRGADEGASGEAGRAREPGAGTLRGGNRISKGLGGRYEVCVGILTHTFDEDYEEGRRLIEQGAPLS